MLHFLLIFPRLLSAQRILDELTYAVWLNTNGTIQSAHVGWTDEYGDTFKLAFVDEQSDPMDFLLDDPKPEVRVTNDFQTAAFNDFMNRFENHTDIGNVKITVPNVTASMESTLRRNPKVLTRIETLSFNSYDQQLIREMLRRCIGSPSKLQISFFAFHQRSIEILGSQFLDEPKIRGVGELNMKTIESDVSDEQLDRLSCPRILIRSSSVSSVGINRILREWQDGRRRGMTYLNIVSDDLQKAEIMSGVPKRPLQRGVWEIKNRFGHVATVSVSRVPSNFFEPKPTFEFSLQ
ncbi:unnamed protein product [Caenorhabditis bovis]|uniref:F-box associated domain-containing protein n=1 Tax=Caenorhabditis bovis TaxID=2654633 RepID=A0A8S1F4A6_9PELO|nr:unnamed protein product [Caenorhabditis bovis]